MKSSDDSIRKSVPQRLKRHDLVMGILYKFSDLYESSAAQSIWDIAFPIDELRKHLKMRFGVEYTSNQWVYTQLRRYEDEIGAKLFERSEMEHANRFNLKLHPNMIEFVQKQHLYVPQKIKLANGIYDKIQSAVQHQSIARVCLGAGSTMYHLAQIFLDRQDQLIPTFQLYTHNAGILPLLYSQQVNYQKLEIFSASGKLDPITRTLIGDPQHIFPTREFDFIIQGTSRIHDGNLYIESDTEQVIKAELLHQHTGCKILVLTKHEFQDEPLKNATSYGKITDYDYVVVPRSIGNENKKLYDFRFEQYLDLFEPEIMNWNYSILKVINPTGRVTE
jgi:DeoR/GlpR family transcriptional regulator of sugar metabolism